VGRYGRADPRVGKVRGFLVPAPTLNFSHWAEDVEPLSDGKSLRRLPSETSKATTMGDALPGDLGS